MTQRTGWIIVEEFGNLRVWARVERVAVPAKAAHRRRYSR